MDVWAPICSWIFHANSPSDLRRMKLVIFCMYSFWYEFNTPHLTIINQTTITSRSFTREKRQAYSLCEAIGEFSAGEGVSVDAWLSVCIMLGKGPPSQKCRLKRSRWGQMTSLLYWESERGRRKEGATKAKNEGEWEGKKGNFILKRAWPFSSSLSLCLLRLFLSRLVRTPSLIWVRLFHAERRETAALVWSARIPQIVSPHCSSFKVASRKKKVTARWRRERLEGSGEEGWWDGGGKKREEVTIGCGGNN